MSESKKFYVKQVPLEWQESPLFLYNDEIEMEYPDIILDGNRDYISHTTDLYDNIFNIIENSDCEWNIETVEDKGNQYGYKTVREVIEDYFPKKTNNESFTDEEIKNLRDCIMGEFSNSKYRKCADEENMCEMFSVISGREYDFITIRGSSQSDWQMMYYPKKTEKDKYGYDKEFIKLFECEYFNEGSEWIVHDEDNFVNSPDDIEGYSIYTHGYNTETNKEELAQQIGCKPEDIVMWKVSGSHQVTDYKLDA